MQASLRLSEGASPTATTLTVERVMRFDRLAPETLATIRRDCAVFNVAIGDASHNKGIGAKFWESRQIDFSKHWSLHQAEMCARFPRLKPWINDDGRIVFA